MKGRGWWSKKVKVRKKKKKTEWEMQLNLNVPFNAQTVAWGKEVLVECDSKVKVKRKGQ